MSTSGDALPPPPPTAARARLPCGEGELRDALRQDAAARVRERAKRARERVGPQLPLGGAGRALERIGRLPQVLAVAHELEPAERGRPRRRDAPFHDVRPGVVVVQRRHRHHVGLALQQLHEQRGELLELDPLGIGAPALGDVACAEGRPASCSSWAASASAFAVSASLQLPARRTKILRSSTARTATCLVSPSKARRPSRTARASASTPAAARAIAGLFAISAAPRRARAIRTNSSGWGAAPACSSTSRRSRYSPASRAKKSAIPTGLPGSVIALPS